MVLKYGGVLTHAGRKQVKKLMGSSTFYCTLFSSDQNCGIFYPKKNLYVVLIIIVVKINK